MKNVLIYVNPSGGFDKERELLARVQIDNSLALGWCPADIFLASNFPFEYNGVKSLIIPGDCFCDFRPRSTNTVTVPYLFEQNLIEPDETYWVHDFDAYQLHPFNEGEPGLEGKAVGFTTYGWSPKWCLGSFFFTADAWEIFQQIKDAVYLWETEDERALSALTKRNVNGINSRYKSMNITYNFGMRHVAYNYEAADKPLKVVHFHPFYRESGGLNTMRIFRDGKNELGFPLITDAFNEVLKHHGI